jgi:hypothetical protein
MNTDRPMDAADSLFVSVRVSRSVAPIGLELDPDSSILSFQSRLLILYDYLVTTEVDLCSLDGRDEEINLATVTDVDSRFSSSFLISFSRRKYDFESFYRNTLGVVDISDVSESVAAEAFQRLLLHEIDSMNHYSSFIFRYLMLSYAMTDIIEGRSTLFCSLLPSFLSNLQSSPLFSAEIFTSALSGIFTSQFADRYLWEESAESEHRLLEAV